MTEANGTKSLKAGIGAGAAGLLLAASMQFAYAEDQKSAWVMGVIADQAQGQKVIAGEYAEAITEMSTLKKARRDAFAVNNNLCVAYTKSKDLSKAGQACADALHASRRTFDGWYDIRRRSDQALALSNRGVIRAVSGDLEGARSDFERAQKLNGDLAAAAANLAHLERQTTPTVSSL